MLQFIYLLQSMEYVISQQIASGPPRGNRGPRAQPPNSNFGNQSQQYHQNFNRRPNNQQFYPNQSHYGNNQNQPRQPQSYNQSYQGSEPYPSSQGPQNRNNRRQNNRYEQPYNQSNQSFTPQNQQRNYNQGGRNNFGQQSHMNSDRRRDDSFNRNQFDYNDGRQNQQQYYQNNRGYSRNRNQIEMQSQGWTQQEDYQNTPQGFFDGGNDRGFDQRRMNQSSNNRDNFATPQDNFRNRNQGGGNRFNDRDNFRPGYQDRRNFQDNRQRGRFPGNNRNDRNNYGSQQFNDGRRYDNRRNDRYAQQQNQPRELTQEDLISILGQKRDVEIENHKILKIPHQAGVPNQHPYIFPSHQNRSQLTDLRLVQSLKGTAKVNVPNTNARMNYFFSLPELQGAQQVEAIRGFKDATGINFNDFERLGAIMVEDLFQNFNQHFR